MYKMYIDIALLFLKFFVLLISNESWDILFLSFLSPTWILNGRLSIIWHDNHKGVDGHNNYTLIFLVLLFIESFVYWVPLDKNIYVYFFIFPFSLILSHSNQYSGALCSRRCFFPS